MTLQRYIVGKPNLLTLPIYAKQEDKSFHWQAGANFNVLIKELDVWCFTDKYIPRLEIDCSDLTPNLSIKVGDVEKMLPYGMYLHKKYDRQKFHSVVKLTPTNLYIKRKNLVDEQDEAIRNQRKKMEFDLIEKKEKQGAGEKKQKHVPEVVQSAKFITAAKKEMDKQLEKQAGKEGGKKK